MKVSYNYLKQLVGFTQSPEEIADLINLHITEVEEVISSSQLQGVVVGEIKEIHSHPNADKLQLTKTDVGTEVLDIVCGAPNIEVGQKVPVATIGALLPNGLEIRSATIRGERSFGMLCSKTELGLETESAGIWILDDKLKVGTPMSEVIGENSDSVYDLKVLTDRPDYLSYLSIAREIAAVLKIDFNPDIDFDFKEGDGKSADEISVEVKDKQLCPRYIGRVIKNIKVGASPEWMQQVLIASGLRPINNIVDISNYILLELGQPTHAFDLAKVADNRIIVRLAKAGESLKGLDGGDHKLTGTELVIADSVKLLAIAGIVGGEESSVTESTTDILLEAANFNMTSIRKTSRGLGIRTDSSARFERGLGVLLPELAMRRMVHLIQSTCPDCQVLNGGVDVHDQLPEEFTTVTVQIDQVNKLAGVEIEPAEMADILTRLDMPTQVEGDALSIQVPNYRHDMTGISDVVEETLRIYGVDKVPLQLPEFVSRPTEISPLRQLTRQIKETLARLGWTEVYLSPFWGKDVKAVQLENPLVANLTHLKTNLTGGLLQARVIAGGVTANEFKIFELNTVFVDEGDTLPQEAQQLSARIKQPDAYRVARGVLDAVSNQLGIKVDYHEVSGLEGLRLLINKTQVGEVRQISKNEAVFELTLDSLLDHVQTQAAFTPLLKYPPIKFDMAFLVSHKTHIGELVQAIEASDILIDSVELFDVHDLGAEGKNLAFHIEIRSTDRTLTSEDRDRVAESIKKQLSERFKARLRES